jgi:HD-GYP domain-containing protein (c-di-GMP phosphodiesterase class II)
VKLPKIFIDGITYHHERLDGSGYPKGLKGTKIPKIARLLAVADFFDAVTSARPHRPALTIGSAIKMMENLVGEIFEKRFYEILVKLFKDQMDDDV